ncbi:hypothetical protein G4B88_029448 [Cannabis sativa]|uniref:Retrotransposon Copia-like N-terminal domain-containing protein n=1 Tax=Cannabis sativa TaxID=3483 RepID=A0A7J6HDY0_CANSA|nr:hypothetical protein G4B88_029448 [Cannabis sativa]
MTKVSKLGDEICYDEAWRRTSNSRRDWKWLLGIRSKPFPLKLDRKNYVLWKTMVSTVIRGHRLDGFVNGSRPCPVELIAAPTTAEGETGFGFIINPEYKNWIVSDQLLMGWLYSSITEVIETEVMGCDSAAALWKALENLYGAHSNG